MTTIRQLYELQEIDLEIAHDQERIASIDGELMDGAGLDAFNSDIEAHQASLQELRVQQRSQDMEAESLRAKLQDIEGRVYGGTVTNLRELEGFEKEAGYLRENLQELDDQLLVSLVALEEEQEVLRSLEEGLKEADARWRIRRVELQKEREVLASALTKLERRRLEFVPQLGGTELKLYETLRTSKGGVAIAKVERGLCRGCRMALPTHQLQRARAGRETVLCNSCGRILYVS